jgi:hypothetical protein
MCCSLVELDQWAEMFVQCAYDIVGPKTLLNEPKIAITIIALCNVFKMNIHHRKLFVLS